MAWQDRNSQQHQRDGLGGAGSGWNQRGAGDPLAHMGDEELAGRTTMARAFLNRVFTWMFAGLLVSGGAAWAVLSDQGLYLTVGRHFMAFAIAELIIVMGLSAMLRRMSPLVATAAFLGYSALNGLTIGVIVSAYTAASVSNAFFTAAFAFGGMAVFGAVTKKDLSGIGSFLMMGVWAILASMVLNFFLHSTALDFVVSAFGALIFTGLTAVDVQRFRKLGFMGSQTEDENRKMALMGALQLYLDFINMFLFLLRLFGRRR